MDQPISKPTFAERMKSLYSKHQELEKVQSSLVDTSPLQEAIYKKDLAEIARLLDSGTDVNERNWYEQTPLMCAVQCAGMADAPESVRSLLAGKLKDLKPAVRENSADIKTALAKIQSIVPKVDEFRKMRNDALQRNRKEADAEGAERRRPATPEDLAVIRFLIDRGADIEARDKDGHSALYSASSSGCDEIANLLLDSRADVEAPDKDGKTPLMAAAEECRPAMVRLLLERGANPHARSVRGGTVLMAAAAGGSLRIVRLILDRRVEINAESEDGTTALLTARGRGYSDVVELLINAGAQPGVLDAIMAGDQTEAERMARLDSARARTRHWGRSVMFWAAREARPDVIRLLHNYGVSANMEDSRGKTPIMHASIRGDRETMRALLECGATPNPTVGEHGMSPLQWAASMGDIDKVRVLIESGANVNEEDRHGGTPLGIAVMRGHIDVARALLEAGANPNARGLGITPMAFAAMAGNTEMVRLLTEYGANAKATDFRGDRPTIPLDVLPGVKENAELMSIIRSASGTDLHEAAKAGDLDRVSSLLEQGRDINGKRDNGRTALFEAAEHGRLDIVCFLLDRGADPNMADMIGRTSLHAAVQHCHAEAAQLLLAHGANPDEVSEQGFTPLLTAVLSKNENREVMIQLLLASGARVGLQEAAAIGDIDTLINLIQFGRDMNEPNRGGLTALMAAAAAGKLSSLEMLIERGGDLDKRDEMGNTALTWAFTFGRKEAARLLLEAGADVNGATAEHREAEFGQDFTIHHTPLMAAVMNGN